MNYYQLISGIILVTLVVAGLIISFIKTPSNLSGYYGIFYWVIALGGLIGGVLLILYGTPLLN